MYSYLCVHVPYGVTQTRVRVRVVRYVTVWPRDRRGPLRAVPPADGVVAVLAVNREIVALHRLRQRADELLLYVLIVRIAVHLVKEKEEKKKQFFVPARNILIIFRKGNGHENIRGKKKKYKSAPSFTRVI